MRPCGLALLAFAFASPAYAQPFDMAAVQRQDARLAAVSFRLFKANADRCPTTRPTPAWVLHDLAQYPPVQRAQVRAHFGLDPQLPSLLAVVEGGPADLAGLRGGDVLEAVNDLPLPAGAADGPATYALLAEQTAALDTALAAGPVQLRVRRGGAAVTVALRGETVCAVDPQITLSGALSAEADQRHMLVSFAMALYAAKDDELAFVVSHELAHVILGHKARRAAVGGDPASQADAERTADRLALDLLDRAGYAVRPAADFWDRLGRDYPATRTAQGGHPSADDRRAALTLAADEIESRKQEPR